MRSRVRPSPAPVPSRGRALRPLAGVAAAALLAACTASVAPSYDDPTPEARLGAMRATAERGTMADAPRLVECLASDDPAVRLAAIGTLERLTGTTLGYRASAPPAERADAVQRWKAWVEREGLHAPAAPPAPPRTR